MRDQSTEKERNRHKLPYHRICILPRLIFALHPKDTDFQNPIIEIQNEMIEHTIQDYRPL